MLPWPRPPPILVQNVVFGKLVPDPSYVPNLKLLALTIPVKFGADIFIQSGVIDIFPKFKMAAAAILDLQIMWIWLLGCVDSVVFVFCTKLG